MQSFLPVKKAPSVAQSLALAVAFVAAVPALHAAPLVSTTVGVYDSTNNVNTVDRTAIGNVTTFTSSMLTAFAANQGGVINFDGVNNNGVQGITANYGTSLSKSLAIGTSATFNNQFSANIRAISGTENSGTGLFLFDANPDQTFTFTLGAITGGAVGEAVTQAGFTVLARNGGGTPTLTVTATFSNLTTAAASAPFTVSSTIPSTTEDTFFGFTAPAGQSITSITLDYGAAGDLRRGIDDFGFITSVVAVPEPSTWAISIAGLGILAMRLRSRRQLI